MFCRFDCGCEALKVTQPTSGPEEPTEMVFLLLKSCTEGEGEPLRLLRKSHRLHRRYEAGESVTPLSWGECQEHIDKFATLVRDGQRGREVALLIDNILREARAQEEP